MRERGVALDWRIHAAPGQACGSGRGHRRKRPGLAIGRVRFVATWILGMGDVPHPDHAADALAVAMRYVAHGRASSARSSVGWSGGWRAAAGGWLGYARGQRIILGIDSGLVDTIWAINGAFGKTTTCRASTVGQACCLVRGLKIPRNGANGFQPLSLSVRFDFHGLSVCVILPCPSDS